MWAVYERKGEDDGTKEKIGCVVGETELWGEQKSGKDLKYTEHYYLSESKRAKCYNANRFASVEPKCHWGSTMLKKKIFTKIFHHQTCTG